MREFLGYSRVGPSGRPWLPGMPAGRCREASGVGLCWLGAGWRWGVTLPHRLRAGRLKTSANG